MDLQKNGLYRTLFTTRGSKENRIHTHINTGNTTN